ncbi:MAG TPA: universal stress protein [Terrimicrobiaceae bacterium]|nr:universal stress protein [Terrimicrobiaceae bacterium]
MNIRRILVALDASAHSRAALEAASDLASRFDAELTGLFVEDINLLRLAELPFAHEVTYPSARRRALDLEAVEHLFKGIAEQARRTMAEVAGRFHVPWTFRVARGRVAAELLAALAEADLLMIGLSSRESGSLRLGSTALATITDAPRAVLLLRRGVSIREPAMVVFDGSEASLKTLAAATDLARACGDGLVVVIVTHEIETATQLKQEATEALKDARHVHFRLAVRAEPHDLIQIAREERVGLFVLPGSSILLRRTDFAEFVAQLGCPVFLVRGAEAK